MLQSQISGSSKTFGVVGGGIIGLAVAYHLLKVASPRRILVFEKEKDVGQHQSGHNSGVLHAGLYYRPGSLKAKLAVTGIRRMKAFCEEQSISHKTCGKLVVACSDEEVARLRALLERGRTNGLSGLRWVVREEMAAIEPHARGLAAVHVPEEGIVDYPQVCAVLRSLIENQGGIICTNSPVRELRQFGKSWVVHAGEREESIDFLFTCAGLHADRILMLAGEKRNTQIVPFKGEYFELTEDAQNLVRNLIYPVPDPRFPFLGVHFTRMIRGGVEAGPNAVLALAREGYRKTDFRLSDVVDTFAFSGFWRFLFRYPSMCSYELWRSISKRAFCRSLQRLVPEIQDHHLGPGMTGVRAQALNPDGTLCEDFDYVLRHNALHLINAPSPGATASLAIADHLIAQALPAFST